MGLRLADIISTDRASLEAFIRERLGEAAYAYVQDEQDDIVTHLRAALGKAVAGELNEATVMEVANACENFLVKLASDQEPPVDLSTKTGIIQKANALKPSGALAGKHLGYMGYLGHLRNAADHGIDPDVSLDWDITPEAARLGIFLALAAFKSIVTLRDGHAVY